MNLYEVQDAERPMYVVAESWQAALNRWKGEIEIENGMRVGTFADKMPEPDGIRLVCANTDMAMPSLLLQHNVEAHNDSLVDRLMTLEGIAPRRIKLPDGRVMIWRCPEHLVPETDMSRTRQSQNVGSNGVCATGDDTTQQRLGK